MNILECHEIFTFFHIIVKCLYFCTYLLEFHDVWMHVFPSILITLHWISPSWMSCGSTSLVTFVIKLFPTEVVYKSNYILNLILNYLILIFFVCCTKNSQIRPNFICKLTFVSHSGLGMRTEWLLACGGSYKIKLFKGSFICYAMLGKNCNDRLLYHWKKEDGLVVITIKNIFIT